MNGPRVQFDRMPSTALKLFIIIKDAKIEQTVLNVVTWISIFFKTSWMTSEQMMMTRQNQANGKGDKEKFVNWTPFKRFKQQGKQKFRIWETTNLSECVDSSNDT